jgi:hypothetical protein
MEVEKEECRFGGGNWSHTTEIFAVGIFVPCLDSVSHPHRQKNEMISEPGVRVYFKDIFVRESRYSFRYWSL